MIGMGHRVYDASYSFGVPVGADRLASHEARISAGQAPGQRGLGHAGPGPRKARGRGN